MEKDQNVCKFELEPLALIRNAGFKAPELWEIRILIQQNNSLLLNRWDEHFN